MPAQYILYSLIVLIPSIALVTLFLLLKKPAKKTEESLKVLQEAIKKSQEMLSSAQVEEIKAVTEANIAARRFEEQVEKEFSATSLETQEKIKQAENTYLQFLEGLKNKALKDQENNQALTIHHINELFEKFEQNLSNFLTQTQLQSVQSIDLELKAARQMVETYKQQQLRLIDENIIAILERTLSLVLTKKLTLKDQVDLVFESLEEAKTEKFIA